MPRIHGKNLTRVAGLLTALAMGPALLLAPSALADPPTGAVVLQGAKNFRDIAGPGLTGDGGRAVRQGVVFRSNALDNLTGADLARLTAANLTLDIDLRNASERAEAPDRLPGGAEYQVADVVGLAHGIGFAEFLPLTLGRGLAGAAPSEFGSSGAGSLDVDWSAVGQYLGYPLMASFRGADIAFRDLLLGIAGNDTGASVFHCSAGKGRTSWGSASPPSTRSRRSCSSADLSAYAANRRCGSRGRSPTPETAAR